MAVSTVYWKYWANGWAGGSEVGATPDPNHAAISAYDGNSHYRTCAIITLGAIKETEKRSKVNITLNISSTHSYGTNPSSENTIYAEWYSGAPINNSWQQQGTLKQKVEKFFDFSGETPFYASFDIDVSSLPKTQQTIYIYFTSQSISTGNYHIFKFRHDGTSVTETTVTDISKVTTNAITTAGSQIFLPTSSIKVSWNAATQGINNSVTGYEVYLRYGAAPTTSTSDSFASTTSTSHTFNISNAVRGKTVWVGVRAKGSAGSSYYGSLITKEIGKINSLPGTPTVTQSGQTVTGTQNVTFTVTAGTDSESNNRFLYYALNQEGKIQFTSPLIISSSMASRLGANNTIKFYTRDSMNEDSAASSTYTFTANFAPVLNTSNTKITHSYATSMTGNTTTLVKKSVISFGLSSGEASSIKIYVKSASTTNNVSSATNKEINSGALVTNLTSKTVEIDISKITSSILPFGNYFNISFEVFNSNGVSSGLHNFTDSYSRRAKMPLTPTNIVCTNDAINAYNLSSNSNYFKDYVTVKANLPTNDAGCARISSIAIANNINSNTTPCSTSSINHQVLLNSIQQGSAVSLNFKVVDEIGQTTISSSFITLTRVKSIAPASGSAEPSVSISILKPLSNITDFKFSHAPVTSASSGIKYLYKIKINKEIAIEETDYTLDASQLSVVSIKITADRIKTLIKDCTNDHNKIFDKGATITFTAVDGFNQTYSISTTFTVDFREAPILSKEGKIGHDYDISRTSATFMNEIPANAITNPEYNKRMFNMSEGIIFALPQATDLNGETDIKEYHIKLQRQDIGWNASTKRIIIPDDNGKYSEWLTIPVDSSLKKTLSNGFYYYRFKASQYFKNEVFRFKIYAKDSTGLSSSEKAFNTYIIGCRTVNPDFTCGDITAERNEDIVKLNYDFKITDLGGSSPEGEWNADFYDNLPNFERSISNRKAWLKIEIAPNQNFTGDETRSIFEPVNGPYQPSGEESLRDYTSKEVTISNFSKDHERIFIRFTLWVSYGVNSSYSEISQLKGLAVLKTERVFTYFGKIPTVSHRSHWVGVNTNKRSTYEAFVVENYQDNRYVIFRGVDPLDASKTYSITFDLLDGSVDGATIDCGYW